MSSFQSASCGEDEIWYTQDLYNGLRTLHVNFRWVGNREWVRGFYHKHFRPNSSPRIGHPHLPHHLPSWCYTIILSTVSFMNQWFKVHKDGLIYYGWCYSTSCLLLLFYTAWSGFVMWRSHIKKRTMLEWLLSVLTKYSH